MKKSILLLLCILSMEFYTMAATPVTTSTFATAYAAAANGDTLLLATGTYTEFTFPTGKTITLMAAQNAKPVFGGQISGAATTDGGLIFDGVEIARNADNFIYGALEGSISILAFRNSTIRNINRCILRTEATLNTTTIGKIEFTNCIVKDCGSNGYNLLYPKHIVREVEVKNSTLYSYTGGESFFFANATNTGNVFTFIFENNTVYKWAKSNDRALCKTEGKYSPNSTYTFKNNIVTVPGVAGALPQIVQVNSGTVTGKNNLIVSYGGYTGGIQTINDLTLAGLGLTTIGFPDPDNGDFTILSSSPLATAGEGGKPVGDPRWIKTIAAPAYLTTSASPAAGGVATPTSAAFEKGQSATVTATKNYGYNFKEWQVGGTAVSTQNPYTFTIDADVDLVAVFEQIPTYTITINKEGDGAAWGKVTLTPEPTNGVYEKDTWVTIAVQSNPVTSFMYWNDMSSELTKTIQVNENKSFTATFDWVPFIVGWDFSPSEPRGNRPGDYYNQLTNQGVMKFFKGDGTTTNWGGSNRSFGATYDCARRYTDYVDMPTPRYFQVEFSARGYTTDLETVNYKSVTVKSYIAADNDCVHKKQKMQYAFSAAGPYTDLITIDLTGKKNQWIECNAKLPMLTDADKENIFIRWVADPSGGLLGTPASNETEGFYLANVFVFAEIEEAPDDVPPVLTSAVPGNGTATASANGTIVLTFNERVKAGANEGRTTFNGKEITPVFSNRSVSYPYSGLTYGTPYTFTLPAGAITDMSGNAYAGTTIAFTTMTRPQPSARLFDAVVAVDGTGNYTTIQAAIEAAPTGRTIPWLIFIKNGSYKGTVLIPSNKPFMHLIGQDKEKVIIHEKLNVQGNPENDKGQSYYANSLAAWEFSVHNPESPMYQKEGSVVKINSANFYAENISFVNDWGVESQNGPQALAMYTNNDKSAFYNCNLRSFQDTWQTSSNGLNDRTYVNNCWIEGAVDYFYGGGNAYVENTTLYNVRSGSVIVAPSHKAGTNWGYVFSSCVVDGNTAANSGQQKLGRPWHNEPVAVYLNTTMKITIHPEGWTDMGPAAKLFAEYNSMDANGNPLDLSQRRTWYKQSAGEGGQTVTGLKAVLTAEEAAQYTYENVTSGADNWNPRALFESVAKPTNLKLIGSKLSWRAPDYAICYIILKGEQVVGFTVDTEYNLSAVLPDDTYAVRAVGQSGTLSPLSGNVQQGDVIASDDATLKTLLVNGELVANFSPELLRYSVALNDVTTQPQVSAEANDENADVKITQANTWNDTAFVQVTAEDGETQITYIVNFLDNTTTTVFKQGKDLGVLYHAQAGELNLWNLPAGAYVEVYSASGQKMFRRKANGEAITVSATGLCIVRVTAAEGAQAFKVFVK